MPSLLTELRELCPHRPLVPWEARGVAERQAAKLLRLQGVDDAPVPEALIESVPRVRVRWRTGRHLSGSVKWVGGTYEVIVNRAESWGRQRYSLAHEFKHVLDLPVATIAYRDRPGWSAERQRERACEYFAACLLMPRSLVKRAFYDQQIRDTRHLARLFEVSVAAMRIRIEQLRLLEPAEVAT
jgi:hypothetical protein